MKLKWTSSPYLAWMVLFTVVPMFLVVGYSLIVTSGGHSILSLENYRRFMDPLYIMVMLNSLKLAAISTAACLIVGYPMALILSRVKVKTRNIMIIIFIIPMWMNSLLRTYAWMSLLERNGLINMVLRFLGLPQQNLMYTDAAVVLGMVYNFLPFMVLPIYSVLIKIDKSLIEAAQDLGSNEINVFRRVTLPLSLPGVISGILMVFMPAITTFVISRLLGGGQYTLVGNLIEQQFLNVGDWGFGSAISMVLMALILVGMAVLLRYDKEKEGVSMW